MEDRNLLTRTRHSILNKIFLVIISVLLNDNSLSGFWPFINISIKFRQNTIFHGHRKLTKPSGFAVSERPTRLSVSEPHESMELRKRVTVKLVNGHGKPIYCQQHLGRKFSFTGARARILITDNIPPSIPQSGKPDRSASAAVIRSPCCRVATFNRIVIVRWLTMTVIGSEGRMDLVRDVNGHL